MAERDRDVADPFDAIVVRRMQLIIEDILDPLDQARAVAMAGLERVGGVPFDQAQFVETLQTLSRTRQGLNLAITALVQLQKQLECDHEMHEHRLTVHVGNSECRKCKLVVETRYE